MALPRWLRFGLWFGGLYWLLALFIVLLLPDEVSIGMLFISFPANVIFGYFHASFLDSFLVSDFRIFLFLITEGILGWFIIGAIVGLLVSFIKNNSRKKPYKK